MSLAGGLASTEALEPNNTEIGSPSRLPLHPSLWEPRLLSLGAEQRADRYSLVSAPHTANIRHRYLSFSFFRSFRLSSLEKLDAKFLAYHSHLIILWARPVSRYADLGRTLSSGPKTVNRWQETVIGWQCCMASVLGCFFRSATATTLIYDKQWNNTLGGDCEREELMPQAIRHIMLISSPIIIMPLVSFSQ